MSWAAVAGERGHGDPELGSIECQPLQSESQDPRPQKGQDGDEKPGRETSASPDPRRRCRGLPLYMLKDTPSQMESQSHLWAHEL